MSTKVAYSLDFLTEAVLQSEFLRAITPPRQCYGSVGSVTAVFRLGCPDGGQMLSITCKKQAKQALQDVKVWYDL